MQNVIASSITFKSGLKSQFFSLLCFIHGGLLSPMSFIQPQWGIIGWGIGLWDTVLCNHLDLSPFYKLLSFCNSCLQLLPLPSRSQWDWLNVTLLWLCPRSVARGKFTADSCNSGERVCADVCACVRVCTSALGLWHGLWHIQWSHMTAMCLPEDEHHPRCDWWRVLRREKWQSNGSSLSPVIYTIGVPLVTSCDIITNIWIHSLKTGVIEAKEKWSVNK